MSTIVFFIFIMVGLSYWWLWRQKVLEQPWVTEGTDIDLRDDIAQISPTAKTGLIIFLAVVTSLFSLFISAYFMRMSLNDWLSVDEPLFLWLNTALLVLASISIQWCAGAARNSNIRTVRYTLLATGVFTGAFIWGQLLAWQDLNAAGHYLQSNPANAFFYLLTGLHGLHLLGGLWVWSRTTLRVMAGVNTDQVKLSVQLCRTYWHYLLAVWIVLFGILLST